ncbi:MAG TPA: hypothetical protein VEB22_03390 [Phycisphaerales bacterium]|nr:hypothetical protein [Phycisphaerales bacterium]
MKHLLIARRVAGAVCLGALIFGMPLVLSACDRDVSKTKTETTKRTSTPEGVKETTEKTERTVETEKKN